MRFWVSADGCFQNSQQLCSDVHHTPFATLGDTPQIATAHGCIKQRLLQLNPPAVRKDAWSAEHLNGQHMLTYLVCKSFAQHAWRKVATQDVISNKQASMIRFTLALLLNGKPCPAVHHHPLPFSSYKPIQDSCLLNEYPARRVWVGGVWMDGIS